MKKNRIIWEMILIVLAFVLGWYLLPYAKDHTDSTESAFILIAGGAGLMMLVLFLLDNTIKYFKKQ